MPSLRVLREFAPADVERITRLANAVEAATGITPLDDDAWTGLHDTTGRDTGIALAADHTDDGSTGDDLLAYAHLAQHHPGEWSISLAVQPDNSPGPDPRAELLHAALDHIGAVGGGRVTLWVHAATAGDDALARAAGLAPDRELRLLRVPLPRPEPVVWPDGVSVRPFRVGEDEAAWVRVNNRAFAGHPEQGGWTVDMLQAREAEDWFDPEGLLLAFDSGGLAGSCWTKVHPPHPPHEPVALGEIYVIGADPDRHGTGLGRALTAGGLASLADRGITTGMLFVDAANDAAVGLYTRLGFTTHRVDRSYTITLVTT